MKELGYLRIKGLNKREDILGARRGDYLYIDSDCKHVYEAFLCQL